jgi:hypothetical protein
MMPMRPTKSNADQDIPKFIEQMKILNPKGLMWEEIKSRSRTFAQFEEWKEERDKKNPPKFKRIH